MLNFEQIILLAAKTAGDKPLVAAPYELPEVVCRALATGGVIGGYVSESASQPSNSAIAGWWTDRPGGAWLLKPSASPTLLMLSGGAQNEVGGRMLLEARLKGIRRILFIEQDGSVARAINVSFELLRRLTTGTANPVHRLSYEAAFEEMYGLVGDYLRLPADAFAPDRILVITGSLQAGGAERQAAYTAAGLSRRFPGSVFMARTRSGPDLDFYKPFVDAAGVSSCVVPEAAPEFELPELVQMRNQLAARHMSLGFLNLFYLVFHHALLIRDIKPSVVHTFQEYSNIPGGIAADLVGVPRLVLSGRSVAPDNFALFQPYMATGYRALLKRRDVMFLNNSGAGADDYARWLDLPRERFRVIHNGFEFPEVAPDSRASLRRELGIPPDAIVVGSLIGFREEKRPELWLDMARILHRTHPQVRFVVFGQGALLDASRAFVDANGLSDVVKLPGLTSDAWGALSAMDVFVLTSRIEGLPNVMIEAQSMGLPVICTGAGGMFETFVEGETGFNAPADAQALAATVARLVDDPALLKRMSGNARKHAHDAFGIARMIDATLDAYRNAPVQVSTARGARDWEGLDTTTEARLTGILKAGQHSFVADLPASLDCSRMELWEDDHRLNPASSGAAETADGLEDVDVGQYVLRGPTIVFSASDGSDVRFNGHTYRLRDKDAGRDFDDIVIPAESISAEIGHCFLVGLGLGQGSGRFVLWEDNSRLSPGGCLHDDIRASGKGRYSVWGENLYFSSSDNTDPRENGRQYLLRRGRTTTVAEGAGDLLKGAPPERVMRHLIRQVVPRVDFVRGRIVHVGGSLGPGGAERQVLYTLKGLAQHDFESVQLLCYYLAGTPTDRHDFYLPAFRAAGVPVRTIRRQVLQSDAGSMPASLREVRDSLPANLASDIADLFWEFVNLKPQVVHAWLDGNNVRAAFAAALAGVPQIFISGRNVSPIHFDLYESYMDPAYKALIDLPQVTMLNNSEAGRDDYARWLDVQPNRIRVVLNGCQFPPLPSPADRLAAKQASGVAADGILIGTMTRIVEEKQPKLFVEMARVLLRQHQNISFVFYGMGAMRDEVRALVESYGLCEAIRMPGITNDAWSSLAAMDIFALTSRMEGLPNVLIEAQGIGLPVVCTTVGGSVETFVEGKTGFGVASLDPEALAEKVSLLIRDRDLRARMSEAAASFARGQFSVDRMVDRTLDIYRQTPPDLMQAGPR